jgi:hypothetical protein
MTERPANYREFYGTVTLTPLMIANLLVRPDRFQTAGDYAAFKARHA